MVEDNANNVIAKVTYELLCDVETLLGLSYVLPLLGTIARLSKFAQGQHTFICDFVSAMKLVEAIFFTMYCDTNKSYDAPHFSTFLDVVEHTIEAFHLTWWTNPISQVKFVAFYLESFTHSIGLLQRQRPHLQGTWQ